MIPRQMPQLILVKVLLPLIFGGTLGNVEFHQACRVKIQLGDILN